MSDNHYRLLRSTSDENQSNYGVGSEYFSMCDDNSLPSSSMSSLYEFSDVTLLLKEIESLCLSDQFSDVTLVVEKERFPAHRVILASRSTYFRAMFFGGMKEEKDAEVVLHDTPLGAFKLLLRYIYSGRIRFHNLKFELILDIFGLAHKYSFSDLEQALCDYLKLTLHHSSVVSVYAMAHFYSLDDLLASCLEFMDKHAGDVIQTDALLQLSGPALQSIFSRDSFSVAEIMIFNVVHQWIQQHAEEQEFHRRLLDCVRLPLIKMEDLLTIVRPTGLIDPDRLLDTINEQSRKRSVDFIYRGAKLINTNVATTLLNAQIVEGDFRENPLRDEHLQHDYERCTRHEITETEKAIVVELGRPYIINHLQLYLLDRDQRSYSYYVEVSIDKKDWVRIIDNTKYLCRARQNLYFTQRVVKFIRIVGTRASVSRTFCLAAIKAMFTTESFTVDPETTLLKPTWNVAKIANNAVVIEGVSRSRNALINGDFEKYDWDEGYTCHQIGSGSIIIQLPQPYLINSMRILLWDVDDRSYSFNIDTSLDGQYWTHVVQAHELQSWQTMKFRTIPVVFVRIVGTFNTANEVFHCVHFECPADPATAGLDQSSSHPEPISDDFPVVYGVARLSLAENADQVGDLADEVPANEQ